MCPDAMTNECGWQLLTALAGIGILAIIFYVLLYIYSIKPFEEKLKRDSIAYQKRQEEKLKSFSEL